MIISNHISCDVLFAGPPDTAGAARSGTKVVCTATRQTLLLSFLGPKCDKWDIPLKVGYGFLIGCVEVSKKSLIIRDKV